ncbi:hypothetical protein KAR10_06370 [bacterium]|nr:hypothetical protein [bacterium]
MDNLKNIIKEEAYCLGFDLNDDQVSAVHDMVIGCRIEAYELRGMFCHPRQCRENVLIVLKEMGECYDASGEWGRDNVTVRDH